MNTAEILIRLIELEEKFKELKALYGEYDKLVLSLKQAGFTSAEQGGKSFTLIDNYIKEGEEVNTGYRVAFIKHYEIKIKDLK